VVPPPGGGGAAAVATCQPCCCSFSSCAALLLDVDGKQSVMDVIMLSLSTGIGWRETRGRRHTFSAVVGAPARGRVVHQGHPPTPQPHTAAHAGQHCCCCCSCCCQLLGPAAALQGPQVVFVGFHTTAQYACAPAAAPREGRTAARCCCCCWRQQQQWLRLVSETEPNQTVPTSWRSSCAYVQ